MTGALSGDPGLTPTLRWTRVAPDGRIHRKNTVFNRADVIQRGRAVLPLRYTRAFVAARLLRWSEALIRLEDVFRIGPVQRIARTGRALKRFPMCWRDIECARFGAGQGRQILADGFKDQSACLLVRSARAPHPMAAYSGRRERVWAILPGAKLYSRAGQRA